MSERYTDDARMVMALAKKEPLRFKGSYIGAEHYLLAVLQVKKGVAFRMLASLNLDLAELAAAVEQKCEKGLEDVGWGELPQTPRAKRVVQLAVEEARSIGSLWITTGHFLLALLHEEAGVASDVLKEFGVRLEQVRELLPQFPEESSDERAAAILQKIRVSKSDREVPAQMIKLAGKGHAALEKLQRATGFGADEALEEAAKIVCEQRGLPLDLRTTDELLAEHRLLSETYGADLNLIEERMKSHDYDKTFVRLAQANLEYLKALRQADRKVQFAWLLQSELVSIEVAAIWVRNYGLGEDFELWARAYAEFLGQTSG